MQEKKPTTWTYVFYVVLTLMVMQYLFMTLPSISKTQGAGVGFYIGSLIPNGLIIFIFWLIKNRSEKKQNSNTK